MSEENKPAYYAVIPSSVLFNEKLKANEKLLYAVITVLANKEGYCFASNNYLGELLNVQPHTISNWISELNKMNFICVDIIKNDKNEVIQRRIYPNDTPYTINMTYPYTTNMTYPYSINMTEGMSQKRQYNNINNNNINIKIDRFFIHIIKKESENPEKMTQLEINQFYNLLEKLELNYTKEILTIFTKENIEKLKIIIYALKELFVSSKKILTQKITRDKLLSVYENCKNKQNEYMNTGKEINNFFEYYYVSLIKELEKAR